MADKTLISVRTKYGPVFGRASDAIMLEVDEALIFVLAL